MKRTFQIKISLVAVLALFACTPGSSVSKGVVALVDKKPLTNKDLEEFSRGQVYQVNRQSIDGLVADYLLEAEAKKEGKTTAELIKKEVMDKIPQPSEAELKKVYEDVKASGQPLGPFEQMKPQIAQYITQPKIAPVYRAYLDKLKKEAKIEVLMKPAFREKMSTDGVVKGPKNAPVTIVEYFDFQCPPCRGFESEVAKIFKDYPNKVRVQYRDLPLTSMHPYAPKAAEAAYCAQDQDKYWEMREKLFENQAGTGLDVPSLKKYATTLGLDAAKFDKCLDEGSKKSLVDKGVEEARDLKLGGTPSFFVNGVPVSNLSTDYIRLLIEDEIAMKK